VPQNIAVHGVDVFLYFVRLNGLPLLAEAAFKHERLASRLEGFGRFGRFGGRKLHRPKVRIGIDECHAMDVAAGLASDLSDEANLGLFRGIGQAKYQDFIWSEPVSRDNACAVPAQHHGFR
jgi:hypothetical protein